jgi:pyruvate formate lyase activating enzyme
MGKKASTMSGKASLKPVAISLRIGGLARLSTCDWPGELVATVFCQGCAWDCAYCHNPALRASEAESQIPWSSVVDFLDSRHGMLDGVIFSGGEPLLQPAILDAVRQVRSLGFRVGLHTTGMLPERFAELLPLLDWVGFDVKAPFQAYARITGVEQSGDRALASLRQLLSSGKSYEVRTTLHRALLSLEDMLTMKAELQALGVKNYAVQEFRTEGTRPERLCLLPSPVPFNLPASYGEGFDSFQLR